MRTSRILIAIVLLIFIGCKENNTETKKSSETDTAKIQKTNNLPTHQNNLDGFVKESFVISCGSGCAISYSPENIKQLDHKIEFKFNVEMYEDEVVTDNYNETYTFIYDDKYNLIQVKSEDDNKNYLDSLSPDARESFVGFGNGLIKSKQNANSTKASTCIDNSIKLPYNKTIDIKTAKYNTLTCPIHGIENITCDKTNIRYLPLPNKNDVSLILIPQDCGDFNYRYYLVTIKNKNVVDKLYVEGEWYEPDGEDDKEITSFSIDNHFKISVKTKSSNGSVMQNYSIMENGKIKKNE